MPESADKQADRIVANLSAWSKGVQYSVQSALRRAAQSAGTQSRRRLASELKIKPQKLLRRRLSIYARRRSSSGPVTYRVWLGQRNEVDAMESAFLAREAKLAGFKLVPRRISSKAGWYKDGTRFVVELDARAEVIITKEAGTAFGTVYRERLNRELSRRRRAAKTLPEAKRLLKAEVANARALERERGRLPE